MDRDPLVSFHRRTSSQQMGLEGARLERNHKSFMLQEVIDWGALSESMLGVQDV